MSWRQSKNTKAKVKSRARLLRPCFLVSLSLVVLSLALRYLFLLHSPWADAWHELVFLTWAQQLSRLSRLFPYSLAELSLFFLLPLGLLWGIYRCYKRIRLGETGFWRGLLRGFLSLATWLCCLFFLFMLGHGLNYHRSNISSLWGLPTPQTSQAYILLTVKNLQQQAIELRATLPEDANGVYQWQGTKTELLAASPQAYQTAARLFTQADDLILAAPKELLFSALTSRLGIAGFYSPFTLEANVNTAQPDWGIIASSIHELGHLQGFAREDEAEFLVYAVGKEHPLPDFRYACILQAWQRLMNALRRQDQALWQQQMAELSVAVRRDVAAADAYWAAQRGKAETLMREANDKFLKANLQDSGVASYQEAELLILAYWQKESGSHARD